MEFDSQTDEDNDSFWEEESDIDIDDGMMCNHCQSLLVEIIHLRSEIERYQEIERRPKKHFKITPTLYTLFDDCLEKRQLIRSASMTSQSIIQSLHTVDYSYLEEIIRNCFLPLPNPFFYSMEFVQHFLCQCDEMCKLLSSESRLLQLYTPIYVFGDIHGNMNDLLSFAKNLWPLGIHLTPGSFLFLGDYVDRGLYSLEVLAYLFSQKIMFPEKVFLLRGNHEVRAVNSCEKYYQNTCLLGQLKEHFPPELAFTIWDKINDVFDCLPIAATIDEMIFCVHGGIPRPIFGKGFSISLINLIPIPYPLTPHLQKRQSEQLEQLEQSDPDDYLKYIHQLIIELLWSGSAHSQQEFLLDELGFGEGERNLGTICYDPKAIEDFINYNQLSHILKAHETTMDGISNQQETKVISIFSSSIEDHDCSNAVCSCILVDGSQIIAINSDMCNV